MMVLLSWSFVARSSSFFTIGAVEYWIHSPEKNEVACHKVSSEYTNTLEIAEIPSSVVYENKTYTVTKISRGAFTSCSKLTKIEIPSTVRTIESEAFYGCKSLKSIKLPEGLEEVSFGLFQKCSSLESIYLPSSIKTIAANTFDGCNSLVTLELPANLTGIIDEETFRDCWLLKSLTIPSGITQIGEYAFRNCVNLKSLKLPETLKDIEHGAFLGCSSLTSFEIPSNVKIICNSAFTGCVNLTHIVCHPMVAPFFYYDDDTSPYDYTARHLCEKELQEKITLIVPLEASGYTTGEWSLFKKPDEIRLTDTQCNIANQGCCPIGNFSYSRTQMKSGSYATFCLPFDTNLSEVSDKFEAVYIPNQTALLNPDGKLILLLQKYDKNASLLAGRAVVVKLKSGVTDVAFSNNKLMMVESDAMQNSEPTSLHVFDWNGNSGALLENTDVKVSFGGTLTSMTGKGSEYETFNSNGSFGPTKSGVVKAFRAYVLKENAAANSKIKSISLGLEDDSETTGVKMISIPVENKQGDNVYTIDGRLINNTGDIEGLPSGIYIKNHHKIYVK